MIHTETRFVSDNEQKLAVLFALNELGPVTDHQLLTYLTVCDTMNWFSMKLGLVDLEDEGMITRKPHPLGELWCVTDEGTFCLKQFSGRIPVSKRDILKTKAPEWRRRFLSLQQSPAEVIPEPDGRLRLQLRMTEENEILLDIMALLPAGTEVKKLGEKWEKAAPGLYRELVTILLPEPEGEKYEAVYLESEDLTILISLPLKDETEKERIKAAWRKNRNELMQRIKEIL